MGKSFSTFFFKKNIHLCLFSFVIVKMNFNIFKTKQKTPHDLVKHVKDAIQKLEGPDKRKVNRWYIDYTP